MMQATASEPARETQTPPADWDSALYLKYERERTRAARDLLAGVPDSDAKLIFDLGCGPGNSTQLLVDRFPHALVIGVDCSREMLAVARLRVRSAQFIERNIAEWEPHAPADLIFANAALHFLPDHHALMTRLVSYLQAGGCLAVQMPNNMHELSHAAMRMVAADGPWADRLVPIAKSRAIVGPLDDYYRLLEPLCADLDIWQTIYVHPLDGPEGVVEWFEGSGLRPFLEPLDAGERILFLERYRKELSSSYPRQPDGKVLLRYPRLFFVLRK